MVQVHWFASVHLLVFEQNASTHQQIQCDLCETAVRDSPFGLNGKDVSSSSSSTTANVRCICARPEYGTLTAHASIAPAMRRAVHDAVHIDGRIVVSILFMHFDLLLNVRRFHTARFDAFWTLRAGLAPQHIEPCCYAM